MDDARQILGRWEWWPEAIESLRAAWDAHGESARKRAADFAGEFEGRRAAMVFDVVLSRQRNYEKVVRPLVEQFAGTRDSESFATLRRAPLEGYPLQEREVEAIRTIASNFATLVESTSDHDEDGVVRRWAAETGVLEFAHEWDPTVGSVLGIGPALFAYMRMRSGGDAIKIDSRVRGRLVDHGFEVEQSSDSSTLLLCNVCAADLGCSKLELDQLLWWQPPG